MECVQQYLSIFIILSCAILDLLLMRSSLLVHNIIYKVIICTLAENIITYLQKAPRDVAKGTI